MANLRDFALLNLIELALRHTVPVEDDHSRFDLIISFVVRNQQLLHCVLQALNDLHAMPLQTPVFSNTVGDLLKNPSELLSAGKGCAPVPEGLLSQVRYDKHCHNRKQMVYSRTC